MASDSAKKSAKPKSNEEILAEFQSLRNQQRNLVYNLNQLEIDLKEHK
jgi:prefoldin subunit 2